MKKILLVGIIVIQFLPILLHSQEISPGIRIDLTDKLNLNRTDGQFARIFVPDYIKIPIRKSLQFVFHLHGASWVVENAVYKAGFPGILINIHLGGLSSPYRRYFQNPERFSQILQFSIDSLKHHGIIHQTQVKSLVITSFSAGYAGIREILKKRDYYDRINGIILADGLHADSDSSIYENQLSNFVRFARDACEQKKVMIISHSAISTPGYMSTTETANYLIEAIRSRRVSVCDSTPVGFRISVCDSGNFHLEGYRGTSGLDHMQHLYHLDLMLKAIQPILN